MDNPGIRACDYCIYDDNGHCTGGLYSCQEGLRKYKELYEKEDD